MHSDMPINTDNQKANQELLGTISNTSAAASFPCRDIRLGSGITENTNIQYSAATTKDPNTKRKKIGFLSNSQFGRFLAINSIRNTLEARKDKLRVYRRWKDQDIIDAREDWDMEDCDIIVLSLGSNNVQNECVTEDEMIIDKDELEDIRSANRVQLVEISNRIINKAKRWDNYGKEVLVVIPPERINDKRQSFLKFENIMERTARKNKVEIISWGSLLRNSRESEESLYFDDTHASDRGAIIVWQELVKKLREKGEIIRKIEQAYKPIKIDKNMCF